jgi:DNA-binding beta-propeller fold protein YncE
MSRGAGQRVYSFRTSREVVLKTQILLLSLAVAAGTAPALLAQSNLLLVDQKGDRSLAIVDPVAGKVIANVAENGTTGHEAVASPDGRLAYVPIYGNSGVGKPGTDGSNLVVIDLAAQKIVGNVDFGHGIRPHCPVFGPKDGLLYVSTEIDRTISIIDPKTLKIVGTIPTGQPESHMFTISHDGLRAYTANVGVGTVSVLDLEARKVLDIISISKSTQRIAISNDDHWVFTADQTQPRLAVIDTATNHVVSWVPLDGLGYGSAPTRDGNWLLIAVPEANAVDVIDLKTMSRSRSIAVGSSPQEVLVRPDGKTAYVSCTNSNEVDEIDLGTWTVTRRFSTGKGTDGLAWAGAE